MGLLPEDATGEAWVETARWIRSRWPFDRVTALAEIDQDKAALIASELGLAYHQPGLVDLVNDKHAMREALRREGLTAVRSGRPGDASAALTCAEDLGYPLVVKPNGGRGSAGVRVVADDSELVEAFAYASEIGADAGAERACLVASTPMVEQFVSGREFSVEAFTHEGEHHIAAITEKFIDERSHVEVGHVVPARIPEPEHRAIAQYVDAVLTALDVRHGVTHTEVMSGPHGVEIIETHLRKAGDEILELVADATGWVLDEATVDQAATGGFTPPAWAEETARAGRHYVGAAAVWFALAERPGRVHSVEGIEAVQGTPGVREAKPLVHPGDGVVPARSSLDRIARVRVVAADADAAMSAATSAVEALMILGEEGGAL
ncbi:ATP-grasp domain-containing protein [Clavibacter sp. VKM Ac-2872]|uniref:ATP-grasp domain-containing protein n=1 Tax=Clavibacter sp. VKM Ac-2872 TaxID=2783812 RepID=UPI00188A3D7E|nr:ATP-grasp domain-containing protein [Clavibacter sp. VKM Ac-2872]